MERAGVKDSRTRITGSFIQERIYGILINMSNSHSSWQEYSMYWERKVTDALTHQESMIDKDSNGFLRYNLEFWDL